MLVQYIVHANRNLELYDLLGLLHQFLDPLLDLLLSMTRIGLGELLVPCLSLGKQALDTALSPSVPLLDRSLSLGLLFGSTFILFSLILLLECSRVLLELSSDFSLELFGEERRRSRSPQELLELLDRVVRELLTLEIPDHESGFGLRGQLKQMRCGAIGTYALPP
jgi:hypothetical protein